MSQSGFMDFCGAEEERAERGGFLQKRYNISLRLRSNKHVQTWLFAPPPYYSYEMVLFFSTTNFTLKKTKKKQKKSKRVGGRVILIFTFFHARTHTHARKHVVCCE